MSESKEKNNIKEIISFLECIIVKVEENNEILQTKIIENKELLQELKKELNNLKNQSNNCQNTKCVINSIESEGNNDLIPNEKFSNDNKNLNKSEKLTKKDSFNDINNFNFISINQELNKKMKNLLENNFLKNVVNLNSKGGFDRKEINEENKQIKIKFTKQLKKISNKEKNYILKKANFFEKIGKIVRFSHEMGIYIFQLLLEIFKKEIGIHSSLEEKVRLYFSTWIKKSLNENIYKKIISIENIKCQINNLIEIEDENEKNFIYDLFIDLSKLYFHCYLTDIIVQITYANKDESFDWDTMEDDLTGNVEDKNVLFTYLPGLCVNEQFFENSKILVVAYPIENPKKFDIKQFEFKKIEAKIKIPVNNIINKINNIEVKYKKIIEKLENNFFFVEFEINLGVKIPKWDSIKYKFILIDCYNFEWEGTEQKFEKETNYGKCKLQIFINNNFFREKDFRLDLSKKN